MRRDLPATRLRCYADPDDLDREAGVLSCTADGDRWLVVLDETPFFPTGGGQPHDTGRLGEAAVLEVRREGEHVVHVVDAPLAGRVRAAVDRDRRIDHMQQHSGQHLLSATFARLCGAATLSFHLGATTWSIEVDRAVGEDQAVEVEEEASRVIARGIPLHVREVLAAQTDGLPLRKRIDPDDLHGDAVRIVEIAGVDLQACCGTHCATTAGIETLQVTRLDPYKQGTRVSFAAGRRARRQDRRHRRELQRAGELLSVADDEMAAAVERILERDRSHRRRIRELEGRVLDLEAGRLAAERGPIVVACLEDEGADELAGLARRIAARPGHVALLASSDAGATRFVFARAKDVDADLGRIMSELAGEHGFRGGGRGDQARGGGEVSDPDGVLREAARRVGR